VVSAARALRGPEVFTHEALFYDGPDDFVAGTTPFIREGLDAGEPVLVVVGAAKVGALRDELGRDAARVTFGDMGQIGLNPARIIPAWLQFVADRLRPGGSVRGIGEPIWAERSAAELVECQRHESLLNLAFDDGPAWRLMCPYDMDALPPEVLAEAARSHPFVQTRGRVHHSDVYRGLSAIAAPFADRLPDPPDDAHDVRFSAGTIGALRALIGHLATDAGFDDCRRDDLVLAVNELATNSVRYGGGEGRLLLWEEGQELVCEISDRGSIDDPMIGRIPPPVTTDGGRGLWLANQVCDLVQVRSPSTGSVVRLRLGKR
jgi:anti-sigma regulatory factor (Ser/Thr protein kinase)